MRELVLAANYADFVNWIRETGRQGRGYIFVHCVLDLCGYRGPVHRTTSWNKNTKYGSPEFIRQLKIVESNVPLPMD